MDLLKKKQHILFSFIFFCLSIFSIKAVEQDTLSFKDKFLIGAVAGAATTTIIQPLVYIKNRLQQTKSINLRKCCSGLGVNAAGFIPTMAIQNSMFGEVENTLNQTSLATFYKKIIAAIVAGSASAVTSCPRELLIIQQQNRGGNFYDVYRNLIRQHGMMITWKAGSLVAVRNSSFAGCFFVLTPAFSDELGSVAPVAAGSVSAVVTHPLDTIKTRLQADPEKRVKQVFQEVYHEVHPKSYFKSGPISFFRGISPRIAGVATTMTLEYRFREYFTWLYKDKLSKKS